MKDLLDKYTVFVAQVAHNTFVGESISEAMSADKEVVRLRCEIEDRMETMRQALVEARAILKMAVETPKMFTEEQANVAFKSIAIALGEANEEIK